MEGPTRHRRVTPPTAQQLLRAYRRRPTTTLRNRLIEQHIDLVRATADRVAAHVGGMVHAEDLLSAGVLGLMDAIDSFDMNRQVKFTTFSAIRIRFAMFDELRAMDAAPRRVRHRARKLEHTARELEHELGRPASDDELARRLNLDHATYHNWLHDARLAGMRHLSSLGAGGDREQDGDGSSMPADPRGEDPVREAQRRMLREILLRSLSRGERLAVTLYYYEDLTMREIGGVLDLSESRVSQMLTSVRARLRAGVRDSRPDIPDELAA